MRPSTRQLATLAGILVCLTACNGSDNAPRRNYARSLASNCGNGRIEAPEKCDGTALNEATCVSLGFPGGELTCRSDCRDLDRSACTAPATCGNAAVDPLEACDGDNLNGATCASLGFLGGDLACSTNCAELDTSGCTQVCEPACGERECGPDPVCGKPCGLCEAGTCTPDGVCDLTDPLGPTILELSTNVSSMTPGDSVVFSAIVSDPDGIEDVAGGVLKDMAGGTYGAFLAGASAGAYSLTLSWAEIQAVAPIDTATGGSPRMFLAQFFDQAGHTNRKAVSVVMRCDDAAQAACDGACTNLRTDLDNCGTCANACPADPNGERACGGGECRVDCDANTLWCGSQCAVCPTSKATAWACAGESCAATTCETGSHVCAGSCVTEGPASCGSGCLTCTASAPHQVPVCADHACGVACADGWADGNDNPTDGCEQQLVLCYPDADGDSFTAGEGTFKTSCGPGWRNAPSAEADCDDLNPNTFPGQSVFQYTLPDEAITWDANCDNWIEGVYKMGDLEYAIDNQVSTTQSTNCSGLDQTTCTYYTWTTISTLACGAAGTVHYCAWGYSYGCQNGNGSMVVGCR